MTVPVVPQMEQAETPEKWRVERGDCCRGTLWDRVTGRNSFPKDAKSRSEVSICLVVVIPFVDPADHRFGCVTIFEIVESSASGTAEDESRNRGRSDDDRVAIFQRADGCPELDARPTTSSRRATRWCACGWCTRSTSPTPRTLSSSGGPTGPTDCSGRWRNTATPAPTVCRSATSTEPRSGHSPARSVFRTTSPNDGLSRVSGAVAPTRRNWASRRRRWAGFSDWASTKCSTSTSSPTERASNVRWSSECSVGARTRATNAADRRPRRYVGNPSFRYEAAARTLNPVCPSSRPPVSRLGGFSNDLRRTVERVASERRAQLNFPTFEKSSSPHSEHWLGREMNTEPQPEHS